MVFSLLSIKTCISLIIIFLFIIVGCRITLCKYFKIIFTFISVLLILLIINIFFIRIKEIQITNIYLNNNNIKTQVNTAIKNNIDCKKENKFCKKLTTQINSINDKQIETPLFIEFIKNNLNKGESSEIH